MSAKTKPAGSKARIQRNKNILREVRISLTAHDAEAILRVVAARQAGHAYLTADAAIVDSCLTSLAIDFNGRYGGLR